MKEQQESSGPSFGCRPARFELNRDVVLPGETQLQLTECLAKIRFYRKIYVDWEFRSVDPMGRSTILNFHGSPGTGKTMAADAFAGALGLPLIEISIAEVESKFMGETARNIQAAFAQAYKHGAVLFFDEADTLLGKRLSSVTQGIDNEVNAMRSTLLIELERFEGVVIFATNFARNYDEAFRSRITHHVHFQLPDLAARRRLWERMLVKTIPLGDEREALLDTAAALSDGFSGRDIRNAMRLALPKALLAAESGNAAEQLCTVHIEAAIGEIVGARQALGRSAGSASAPDAPFDSHANAQPVRRLLGIGQ